MHIPALSIAYWCVLVAAMLPYICAYIAKAGAFGGHDNQKPRDWAAQQTGWRARAIAAQTNSFEGLPFFIGAVIVAHQLGASQGRIDLLATAYVVFRIAFIALYIGGMGTARSAVFALGLFTNIAILFAGR
ncbi:MAPEG family protein [Variovorax sp. RHLX14]|uniref:MAPEG family protein n=1 Tax=Variovorax sp. RHLX14 TaxID=1259731 RepID=UPI003F485374